MKRLLVILLILAAVGLAFGTATRSEATSQNAVQKTAEKYEVRKT